MALSLPVSFCNVTLNLVPQLTAQFSGCQLKKKIKKTEKSHCQKKQKTTPPQTFPLQAAKKSLWFCLSPLIDISGLTGGMRLWQQWDVTNSGTIAGAENEGDKIYIYIYI